MNQKKHGGVHPDTPTFLDLYIAATNSYNSSWSASGKTQEDWIRITQVYNHDLETAEATFTGGSPHGHPTYPTH